jgi:pyruvate dehydrogenase E2 component (dihydrolipoamide acetyltransferase)
MAREIVMPQLGLSMDTGRILRWLCVSGDFVRKGEALLEVESDKATIEVEAAATGTIHIVEGLTDRDLPVGTVIGYLLDGGEALSTAAKTASVLPSMAVVQQPSARKARIAEGAAATEDPHPNRPPSSPAARRRARELGLDWRQADGTGPHGRIKTRDVEQLFRHMDATRRPTISPVARRLAEATGLSLQHLREGIPDRRIERADVEEALREITRKLRDTPPDEAAATTEASAETSRQPMPRMRQLIAKRMAHGAHTNALVTLTTEVCATELIRLRESLSRSSDYGISPSYNALLACLCSQALVELPALHAYIDGDDIVQYHNVHIGIAVETESGLVVPVVRNVNHKTVRRVAQEVEEILERAVSGKAVPNELAGSTFTITNLGIYGIDTFTPIVNVNEGAILGVGRIQNKLVSGPEDKPIAQARLSLSLTFDHRLADGGPAARLLQRIGFYIEEPYLWLSI